MDADPYCRWGLRPIALNDQALFRSYFSTLREPLSDYTFAQQFIWRNSLTILWREIDSHLCVFANGSGDISLLLPPVGDGGSDRALRSAFELMDDFNASVGLPDASAVEYASDELLARCDAARMTLSPIGQDYVYDVARMIDLAGGDLKSKRQEKNRFQRHYASRVEPYDVARHGEACLRLLQEWKRAQDEKHADEPGLNAMKRRKESLANEVALAHAPDLGLTGLVVLVRDASGAESVRGFTFGEPLDAATSSVLIEKTDLQCKGLAQFIFSEFCRLCWGDRAWVNAGDDWGLPSLAWTKQSYRPARLLPKFYVKRVRPLSLAVPSGAPSAPATIAEERPPASVEELPGGAASLTSRAAPPIVVRAARPEDVPAIARIEEDSFNVFQLRAPALRRMLDSPARILVVAEREGALIGEAVASVRHASRGASGRIESIAVDAAQRGLGVGAALLRRLLDDLRRRAARSVRLEVESGNLPAIRLYERNGFRPVGRIADFYGEGRAALRMVVRLSADKPVLMAS